MTKELYGAIEAAKAGAVGVLVRSLTHSLDTVPHTGAMSYEKEFQEYPLQPFPQLMQEC